MILHVFYSLYKSIKLCKNFLKTTHEYYLIETNFFKHKIKISISNT